MSYRLGLKQTNKKLFICADTPPKTFLDYIYATEKMKFGYVYSNLWTRLLIICISSAPLIGFRREYYQI